MAGRTAGLTKVQMAGGECKAHEAGRASAGGATSTDPSTPPHLLSRPAQTEVVLPPLTGRQLFEAGPDGAIGARGRVQRRRTPSRRCCLHCCNCPTLLYHSLVDCLVGADFRGELLALHRELVAQVLELLAVLTDKPSMWARQVCVNAWQARRCEHPRPGCSSRRGASRCGCWISGSFWRSRVLIFWHVDAAAHAVGWWLPPPLLPPMCRWKTRRLCCATCSTCATCCGRCRRGRRCCTRCAASWSSVRRRRRSFGAVGGECPMVDCGWQCPSMSWNWYEALAANRPCCLMLTPCALPARRSQRRGGSSRCSACRQRRRARSGSGGAAAGSRGSGRRGGGKRCRLEHPQRLWRALLCPCFCPC